MHIDEDLKPLVNAFLKQERKNMGDALGIRFTVFTKNRVEATMPVNENTIQPFGLLHGGASVALGETICSVGAWLNTDPEIQTAVGLEINANHVRAVRSGLVTGIATPIHKGVATQVWKYEIFTESDKLVCSGRCTMAVIQKRKP